MKIKCCFKINTSNVWIWYSVICVLIANIQNINKVKSYARIKVNDFTLLEQWMRRYDFATWLGRYFKAVDWLFTSRKPPCFPHVQLCSLLGSQRWKNLIQNHGNISFWSSDLVCRFHLEHSWICPSRSSLSSTWHLFSSLAGGEWTLGPQLQGLCRGGERCAGVSCLAWPTDIQCSV